MATTKLINNTVSNQRLKKSAYPRCKENCEKLDKGIEKMQSALHCFSSPLVPYSAHSFIHKTGNKRDP